MLKEKEVICGIERQSVLASRILDKRYRDRGGSIRLQPVAHLGNKLREAGPLLAKLAQPQAGSRHNYAAVFTPVAARQSGFKSCQPIS